VDNKTTVLGASDTFGFAGIFMGDFQDPRGSAPSGMGDAVSDHSRWPSAQRDI
jgi:hypothetical protein